MRFKLGIIAAVLAIVFVGLLFTFQRPPSVMVQRGFRGTGMDQVFNKREEALKQYANQLPPVVPAEEPAGTPSSAVYANVQVLGDVDAVEFGRLMTAVTNWVSPKQGCSYCHNVNNMASDELYPKVVARRMFQMVRQINSDWKQHVGGTGVTCYTCHRGNPVPAYIWFQPDPAESLGSLGNRAGVSAPAIAPGMASLPYDPFTPFLEQDNNIRVASTTALPGTDHQSIKQTEWTYSLMLHFSEGLGVNCTYCHNTRSFSDWDQSTPQRGTAWYGIRMVRDLNNNYLDPLRNTLPPVRWGPHGDGPKVNCATCHQGVFKPLYGASMLKDYQELAGVMPVADTTDTPSAPVVTTPTPGPPAPTAPVAPTPPVPAPAAPTPHAEASPTSPPPTVLALAAPTSSAPSAAAPPSPSSLTDILGCAGWSHACGGPAPLADSPKKVAALEATPPPTPAPGPRPEVTGCGSWWSHACSVTVSPNTVQTTSVPPENCAAWSHACGGSATLGTPPKKLASLDGALPAVLASGPLPEVTACAASWSHACDVSAPSTSVAPASAPTESAAGCSAWSHACDAPVAAPAAAAPVEAMGCAAWSHACDAPVAAPAAAAPVEAMGCAAWSHACDAPVAASAAAAAVEAMGCAAWSHACDVPASSSVPESKSCAAWSHAC